MKNYLKNELKHLPMIIIVSIIFCGINTLANNHLFNSKDVDYDNSNTHIESTNVGDAIDELFNAANNFTTYDTRLQGVESKVGTGTLNTTAQNLIGGVNELNNKLTSKIKSKVISDTTSTSGNLPTNIRSSGKYLLGAQSAGHVAIPFIGSNEKMYIRILDPVNGNAVVSTSVTARIIWTEETEVIL